MQSRKLVVAVNKCFNDYVLQGHYEHNWNFLPDIRYKHMSNNDRHPIHVQFRCWSLF